MCYAPDPDKENTVQQLGWVDKRLTVQTALSHSVKQKLKQYWREEEQSKCRAVCAAVVLMRYCDRGEKCAEHRQVRWLARWPAQRTWVFVIAILGNNHVSNTHADFKSMEEAKKKASANPKPVEAKKREIKTVQIRKEWV
jgi:hypothetical protein